MKQEEMSRYLKAIIIGVSIIFFIFIVWFLPSIFRQMMEKTNCMGDYWGSCIVVWISAIPGFVCLWKFWGVCHRIGKNQSFSRANAIALKQMSQIVLVDCGLYTAVLAFICIMKWYVVYGMNLLFGVLLILVVCITLTVLCAALSHLVYKASELQEEQDLTI